MSHSVVLRCEKNCFCFFCNKVKLRCHYHSGAINHAIWKIKEPNFLAAGAAAALLSTEPPPRAIVLYINYAESYTYSAQIPIITPT